jgi:hypothetical protein
MMGIGSITGSKGPSITLGHQAGSVWPRNVNLSAAEIATHKHVIGVTGQGKSRLLQAVFVQLLSQNVGVSMVDPHKDLARDTIAYLAQQGFYDRPEAFRRLIYIDFSLPQYVPFNVLSTRASAHDTAYAFLEAVKRAWPSIGDGTAPQLENVLLAAALVLVQAGLPVTRMHDLLTDKAFRDELLEDVDDDQARRFFLERYDRWGREAPLMIESTLRRVFLLTFAPVLRNTLGQAANALDFRRFIDNNVSVIYDLGGVENPDARRLLGCLITVGYEMAALSRADLPGGAAGRNHHHLILDEFAEFVAQSEESLARMLSLCRKYGLYLTLAHQTWSQASDRLRGALQNCGAEVVFKLGRADAELTSKAMGSVDPYLVKDDPKTDYQNALYMDLASQWELWTQAIQGLKPRQAFVRTPQRNTTRIKTVNMADANADDNRLRRIFRTYAELYQPEAESANQGERFERRATGERFRSMWGGDS